MLTRENRVMWQILRLTCSGKVSHNEKLIHILTVAAPDLLDPKSAAHNSKPRLSFSTKPVVLNTPDEDECDTRTTVMRWKTVSAIFFLVVLYLIIGATVFSALEQPHESSQKLAILAEKLDFLAMHACVNSSELEALVKVGGSIYIVTIIEVFSPLTWWWLNAWKKRRILVTYVHKLWLRLPPVPEGIFIKHLGPRKK